MHYLDNPLVESYLDLHVDNLNHTIRAGDPLKPLRILRYIPANATPNTPGNTTRHFYFLGRSGWHDARDIIQGAVIEGSNATSMFEEPLPDPIDPPAYLGEAHFSQQETEILFAMLRGEHSTYIEHEAGGKQLLDALLSHAARLGLSILPAKYAGTIEQELRDEAIAQIQGRSIHSTHSIPATQSLKPATLTDPDNPHAATLSTFDTARAFDASPTDSLRAYPFHALPEAMPEEGQCIGPITPLPAEVFERMKQARKFANRTSTNVSWPFKNMQVGDHVVVTGPLAARAYSAAHVFAHRNKRVFTVHKNKATGAVTIARMPDK